MEREIWLYTNWNEKEEMICVCWYGKPLCTKVATCEFLKAKYNPFDDIETVMRDARRYKRVNGRMREVK